MSDMSGYFIKNIKQNKGKPRLWLDTHVKKAGMAPGQQYEVIVEGQSVILKANPDGTRIVTGKKEGDKTCPIIDLNSNKLLAIFDGMACVRVMVSEGEIIISPLASELKKQERYLRLKNKLESGEALDMGSLSHGVGVLSHAMHEGLKEANINVRLSLANEIRPELLEQAALHNSAWDDRTIPIAAPLQELAFDERGLAKIPKLDILEMGLPCSGASVAGMAKNGLKRPEQHPDVGHLFVGALIIINKTNPAIIEFENVPNYAQTASADVLRLQLRDLGYETHERILRGEDWGTLEPRNRWVMVAVTHGIQFDFDQLVGPGKRGLKLGDALESIAEDDPRWSQMSGLKAKQERDIAAGKGFRMQIFTPEDERIGTITKGYAKVRSTDPKIAHPSNPELLRQLYPSEHARIKEIPPELIEGLSETTAHEVLGQSVIYPPFKDLGKHIGQTLNVFHARGGMNIKAHRDEISLISKEAIALAKEVVEVLRVADTQRGEYTGRIVAISNDAVIQDVGREGVLHSKTSFESKLSLGQEIELRYRDGKAQIIEKQQPQLALEL